MKHLVYILILAGIMVGCDRSDSDPQPPSPEISVDPWIPPLEPPTSRIPDDEFYEEDERHYYPQDTVYGVHQGPGDGDNQQPVPEPNTFILVGGGAMVIAWCRRKKKQAGDIE